jgi:hypothetical protein
VVAQVLSGLGVVFGGLVGDDANGGQGGDESGRQAGLGGLNGQGPPARGAPGSCLGMGGRIAVGEVAPRSLAGLASPLLAEGQSSASADSTLYQRLMTLR